ncbi:aspartate-semialdehyde dehydrogenase [Erythrobacter sp. Alg231-14]|uniref:aspartate-semialdehyde dehydrogenase n=1 Tax=Erythrobacter sp. Alg231-14 TaxID=1922225 RepID=UPI000D54D22E
MRAVLLASALLVLSACDDGSVPSPADRLEGSQPAQAIDTNLVTLRSDGMIVGAEAFYFAAGQTEVQTALTRALGVDGETTNLPECGAGLMESTQFDGGLTVNFQGGNLVGWILDERSDSMVVSSDIEIGTDRATLESMPRYSAIEDSTLGEEFLLSGEVAGFVEDDAVSMIYSGVQCFFR